MSVFQRAINMALRDHGLQAWPSQIEKIKQLHSQILVRHGVMMVGPSGGGKTTIRSVLQRALVLLPAVQNEDLLRDISGVLDKRKMSYYAMTKAKKGHVETFTVNPKCVKLGELYGETDPNTFEWSDGLIASATRKLARDAHQSQQQQQQQQAEESSRPQSAGVSTHVTCL